MGWNPQKFLGLTWIQRVRNGPFMIRYLYSIDDVIPLFKIESYCLFSQQNVQVIRHFPFYLVQPKTLIMSNKFPPSSSCRQTAPGPSHRSKAQGLSPSFLFLSCIFSLLAASFGLRRILHGWPLLQHSLSLFGYLNYRPDAGDLLHHPRATSIPPLSA